MFKNRSFYEKKLQVGISVIGDGNPGNWSWIDDFELKEE